VIPGPFAHSYPSEGNECANSAVRPAWGPAIGAMAATLVTVAAAFAWPGGADVLIRLLVAGLVVGSAIVHARRTSRRLAATVSASPFDRPVADPGIVAAPRDLAGLTSELTWMLDPSRPEPVIDWSIRSRVRHEAATRLAEHHGLRLADPADHGRIAALVSRPLWALIGPPVRSGDGRRPPLVDVAVPAHELAPILDELENL
jgi:hypothetical protein